MIEPDRGSGENYSVGPAQRVADFLTSHGITISYVPGGNNGGVDQYYFFREQEEIGVVTYHRGSGKVLPVDDEEMRRRFKTPGLIPNVTRPFASLLTRTGGDFHAEPFDLVHTALAAVELAPQL
jgi:hypothetical protein